MTRLALFLVPSFAAAVVSYLLAPLAGRVAHRVGAIDLPGPRKIHASPIPRLGGLAVVAGVFVGAVVLWSLLPQADWTLPRQVCLGIVLGVLPIVGISIADDIAPLRPGPKFVAHLVGAVTAVSLGVSLNSDVHLFGHTISIGLLAFPLSVLWMVGATNAFNIVDGLDGLSAGLALISAGSLAGVFVLNGQYGMASAVLVLAGALGGFLPFNIYPARMFLGDTGATAIGFCLAAFALRGGATLSAGFATLLPVFALGLPIAETLISMSRRLLKRLEQRDAGGVFQPDKNHMHHRLLALGIEHPRAVFILYGAGLLLACGALGSMFLSARHASLFLVALLLAGFLGVKRLDYDEFAVIRNGVALRLYETPIVNKAMFVVFVDLTIVAVATYGAMGLKTDVWRVAWSRQSMLGMIALLAPITVMVFSRMGLYRGSWRLAGIEDFTRASIAVVVATALGATANILLAMTAAPASTFSIYALLSLLMVVTSRASYQILVASQGRASVEGRPVIVYGAGRKGASVLRELRFAAGMRPVAFIDDDPRMAKKIVNGLPVVGAFRHLEAAVRRFSASAVIVSTDRMPEERAQALGELCERVGVALLKMQVTFDQCAGTTLMPDAGIAHDVGSAGAPTPAAPRPLSGLLDETVAFASAPRRIAAAPVRPVERHIAVEASISHPCPACRSLNVRRSPARTVAERVRKKLTDKRLYRCQQCGWRGWSPLVGIAAYQPLSAGQMRKPVLERIDAVLQKAADTKLAAAANR